MLFTHVCMAAAAAARKVKLCRCIEFAQEATKGESPSQSLFCGFFLFHMENRNAASLKTL